MAYNHPAPGTKPKVGGIVHFRYSESTTFPAEIAMTDVSESDSQEVHLRVYGWTQTTQGRMNHLTPKYLVKEGTEVGQWHWPEDGESLVLPARRIA